MTEIHSLRAFSRLHFGLVDLSGITLRSYGGAGAAISGPRAVVEVDESASFYLDLDRADPEAQRGATAALKRARELGLPLAGKVTLVEQPPSHVGLGSTTATIMALLQSAAIASGWRLSRAEMVALSGRGRTSAIGCNVFFDGGLIIDAGQKNHPNGNYMPSLLPAGRPPSLRIGRWNMSADWSVHLLFTAEPPTVPPHQEAAFFESVTPLDGADTLRQLAALYHGIIPAALEADLEQFAVSLRDFQSCGFKAREIAAQPERVRSTLAHLWAHGHAAGLSSLGPTVFVVSDRADLDLRSFAPDSGPSLGPLRFRNKGFKKVPSGLSPVPRTSP